MGPSCPHLCLGYVRVKVWLETLFWVTEMEFTPEIGKNIVKVLDNKCGGSLVIKQRSVTQVEGKHLVIKGVTYSL